MCGINRGLIVSTGRYYLNTNKKMIRMGAEDEASHIRMKQTTFTDITDIYSPTTAWSRLYFSPGIMGTWYWNS